MARRAGKAGSKAKKAAPKSTPAATPRRREVLGVLTLSLGVTLLLALWSYTPRDVARLDAGGTETRNLIGPVGHHVADILLAGIGLGAFVVALALVAVALALFARRAVHLTVVEAAGYVGLVVAGAVLAHLALPGLHPLAHTPGGVVGVVLGELLRSWLATVGATIVAVAASLLALMLASDFTVARLAALAGRAVVGLVRRLGAFLRIHWARHQEARVRRAARRAERAEAKEAERARIEAERAAEEAIIRVKGEDTPVEPPAPAKAPPPPKAPASKTPPPQRAAKAALPPPSPAGAIAPRDDVEAIYDVVPVDPMADPAHADPAWAPALAALRPPEPPTAEETGAPTGDAPEAAAAEPEIAAPAEPPQRRPRRRKPDADATEEATAVPAAAEAPSRPTPLPARARRPAEIAPADDAPPAPEEPAAPGLPTIVEAKAPPLPARKRQETFAFTTHGEHFHLPSLDLLDEPPKEERVEIDKEALHETARRLKQKLADFGITGEVQKIRLGPVVTMYEFVPGPGVKISKIAGLADDLAMAMEALRVRIVAPLPGKGAVGIEVPNRDRQTVYLREILEQDAFAQTKSKLTLAMGKDVEGMPFLGDLAQMPHLLIAGTTGSGKSVSVNAMITSILYKCTPDEVRFIMVDPKWTELSLYEGIPHLLLPVVKDPAKAALALRWAVDEMERRYQLLAEIGVRTLAGYNREAEKRRKAWEQREAERPPLPPLESVDGDAQAYEELKRRHEERLLADPLPPEKLPLIVIVIDELADLMMVASREVETYIARIAQKARAAGLHLMVATQRPSTDVLTGLIKVNFPARIGFRVASRHDSQTIINQPGSEKLLGRGDMLIIPPGQADPLRVHGAFVADDEIKRVVAHLQSQGQPIYDESILKPRDEDGPAGDDDGGEHDAKWDEAVLLVSERESISVSFLQRRLGIGYNRAARMIEQMEREGIVGPADGSKPREVLISAPPA